MKKNQPADSDPEDGSTIPFNFSLRGVLKWPTLISGAVLVAALVTLHQGSISRAQNVASIEKTPSPSPRVEIPLGAGLMLEPEKICLADKHADLVLKEIGGCVYLSSPFKISCHYMGDIKLDDVHEIQTHGEYQIRTPRGTDYFVIPQEIDLLNRRVILKIRKFSPNP